MDYETIIEILKSRNKNRMAAFVKMYYLDNKTQKDIMLELYIDTQRGYYSMRRRVKSIINTLIEDEKKIKKV